MVKVMRAAAFCVAWCLVSLPAAAQAFDPLSPHVGSGNLQMVGTPTDFITGGREYRIGPGQGTWSGTIIQRTGEPVPLGVRIFFTANNAVSELVGDYWDLEFHVTQIPGAVFGPGTYTDAMRAPFTDPGHPGLSVTGDHRGCNTNTGRFEVTALEFDCLPSDTAATALHLRSFAATFEQRCEGGTSFLRGSIVYNAPATNETCDAADGGGDDGGGDDGGGDTPPAPTPPPAVQVTFPANVWTAPLTIANNDTRTVTFDTLVDGTFNSDLTLSVVTNASPTDDFHVEITPSFVSAPGSAQGEIKIRTGAMTFPRTYTVTVLAYDGTQFYNSSFLVDVQCTPPFILGIDQPTSVAATGGNVQLQTKASGSGPFTYQWYRGFPGMTRDPVTTTGASLTVPNDSSSYWVRVRNACGSFDSQVVRASAP